MSKQRTLEDFKLESVEGSSHVQYLVALINCPVVFVRLGVMSFFPLFPSIEHGNLNERPVFTLI